MESNRVDNKKPLMVSNVLNLLYIFVTLFVFLYRPNLKMILGFDGNILIIILSVPLFVKAIIGTKKKQKINKNYFFAALFLAAAASYIAIRGLIAGEALLKVVTNSLKVLVIIPYAIISSELINSINKIIKSPKDRNGVIECLVIVGLIQAAIAIAMIIIPPFRQLAKNIYYNGGNENVYISASRLYGICDGDYTYGLQIAHSILSLVSFMYAFSSKKKVFYLYSVALLLVTFLNGRTGIIIFLVNLLVFLLIHLFKKKEGLKAILIFFSLALMLPVAAMAMRNIAPNSYRNLEVMIADYDKSKKGTGNTETEAYKNMIVLPPGMDLIIGKGYRIYARNGAKFGTLESSDIGFVNDLYIGGVIYLALLLLAIGSISRLYKKSSFNETIVVALVVAFVIANAKGEFIRQPILISVAILLIVYLVKERWDGKSIRNSSSI